MYATAYITFCTDDVRKESVYERVRQMGCGGVPLEINWVEYIRE
jgi:hypothetical protein